MGKLKLALVVVAVGLVVSVFMVVQALDVLRPEPTHELWDGI